MVEADFHEASKQISITRFDDLLKEYAQIFPGIARLTIAFANGAAQFSVSHAVTVIRSGLDNPSVGADVLQHLSILGQAEEIAKALYGVGFFGIFDQQNSTWVFSHDGRRPNKSINPGFLPSSPLTAALAYARERRDGLEIYLNDPDVAIDTNHLERALRAIPMGRKNWLFTWTELGARQVGIVQSLLVTCRLHDINPYDYFVDVLQRVSQHPASQVHELTPRIWKQRFAQNPLRPDLHQPAI